MSCGVIGGGLGFICVGPRVGMGMGMQGVVVGEGEFLLGEWCTPDTEFAMVVVEARHLAILLMN